MNKRNAILAIDMQNDFCNPQTGSLYVEGAENDVRRAAEMINNNLNLIDYLALTQDSHHFIDIAHPSWWKNKEGTLTVE